MAHAAHSYRSLPTHDEESKPVIVTGADNKGRFISDSRIAKRRRIFFALLSLLFLYMVFWASKSLANGGMWKGCHDAIHRLGLGHGGHRNISNLPISSSKLFELPSGDKIPAIALGVWRASPGEVGPAVKAALKAGYRHIDGAWIYGNEAEVGEALRSSSIARSEIWLTSKLWNTFHKPDDVERALDESLQKLGVDYLDLYLIHWPVAFKNSNTPPEVDIELSENPYPTWQKLEEMVQKGKVRNIGISNFNIRRVQNLTANPLKIKPAVNQVELNYWNPQPELLKWSKENGILLEAYSPLGSAEKVKETLEIPVIKSVAKELGITPAQVYISWHVQRGTIVLPKSVTPSRIEENLQLFTLPQDAFERVEKAAVGHPPVRFDPSKGWGYDIFG